MYEYINGILESKKPTEVVLDVNGIGYFLKISLSTYKKLPVAGSSIKLKCYLHVREDILQLFGFNDDDERNVFIGLLSVSGIGPKLAQTILSGLTPDELVQAIRNGDEKTLNSISGVGKKTAQRLVVELQDKFGKIGLAGGVTQPEAMAAPNGVEQEAIMALLSLGYNRATAAKAIDKAQATQKITVVEDLLKKSLQVI